MPLLKINDYVAINKELLDKFDYIKLDKHNHTYAFFRFDNHYSIFNIPVESINFNKLIQALKDYNMDLITINHNMAIKKNINEKIDTICIYGQKLKITCKDYIHTFEIGIVFEDITLNCFI